MPRIVRSMLLFLLPYGCAGEVQPAESLPEGPRAEWADFDADAEPWARVAPCPAPARADDTCWILPDSGEVFCTSGAPVSIASTVDGLVLDIDMAARSSLAVDTIYADAEGWVLNIANSPTNNGYAGDRGTTSNDSEAQLLDDELRVYLSDRGGNELALSEPGAIDPERDRSTALICDGFFGFRSSQLRATLGDPFLFQIDGDEPDDERGTTNDTLLHVGFERVVGATSRVGDGAPLARIRIAR